MMFGRKALVGMAAAALLAAPMSGVATAAPVVVKHSHNATGWTAVGHWKKSTDYHVGDVVRRHKKAWVAVVANKGHKPHKDSKYWSLVVAGTTGPIGPTGPAGTNGTNGTNGVNGAPGAPGAVGPNWVVKDRAGTTLGVFAGADNFRGNPNVHVIFEGGLWTYTSLGTYNLDFGVKAALAGVEGYFLDDTCSGMPYLEFPSAEMAQVYVSRLGDSMFRLIYATSDTTFVGAKLSLTAPVQAHTGSLWYLDDGDWTCDEYPRQDDQSVVQLTPATLPPASVGGLYVTQP